MTRPLRRTLPFLAGALLLSCQPAGERAAADSLATARADSIARARPGYVVDSIFPIEEEIRRFRAEVGDSVAALEGGEPTREALVRAFVRGVEARDTSAIVRAVLTPQEFAWLVFESSEFARPPMRTKPGVAWTLIANENAKALGRLLDRVGGSSLGYVSHRCEGPERQGENRVWRDCTIRHARAPGDTVVTPLFASILQRDGRFKLYSLANPF